MVLSDVFLSDVLFYASIQVYFRSPFSSVSVYLAEMFMLNQTPRSAAAGSLFVSLGLIHDVTVQSQPVYSTLNRFITPNLTLI